ncbi:winged helix-turn-helix transcriptional regulator [Palaeococcus sp. (in: euryarchaeotes)]
MGSTREQILQYISINPGITFRRLVDELGMGIGNVQYHLHVLEKRGLIVSKKMGGKRYLFPKNFEGKYEPLLRAISTETQRKILLLLSEGEKNQSEISSTLKLSPATINYHTKQMEKLGLIKRNRRGREVIYQPNFDIETLVRVISEYRPKLWDKLADKLIDMMVEIKGEEE